MTDKKKQAKQYKENVYNPQEKIVLDMIHDINKNSVDGKKPLDFDTMEKLHHELETLMEMHSTYCYFHIIGAI